MLIVELSILQISANFSPVDGLRLKKTFAPSKRKEPQPNLFRSVGGLERARRRELLALQLAARRGAAAAGAARKARRALARRGAGPGAPRVRPSRWLAQTVCQF